MFWGLSFLKLNFRFIGMFMFLNPQMSVCVGWYERVANDSTRCFSSSDAVKPHFTACSSKLWRRSQACQIRGYLIHYLPHNAGSTPVIVRICVERKTATVASIDIWTQSNEKNVAKNWLKAQKH
jgi:hypothetical protein